MTPRRDPRAAPRVPVALAPCATTIRVYRARPRPRAWPECRERVRRPAPRHPLWGRSAPPQRVGPHPSNKTSQLLMSRQSERQRRPPRGWRRGPRSGPRVRAAANAPARNRMRRGAPAFALLRTVVWCIYMYVWLFEVAEPFTLWMPPCTAAHGPQPVLVPVRSQTSSRAVCTTDLSWPTCAPSGGVCSKPRARSAWGCKELACGYGEIE